MKRMFRIGLFLLFVSAGSNGFSQMMGGLMIPSLESQYPSGSVFCTSGPTAIVEVTNPTTGRIWMDRNLGASRVATDSADAQAYGDLYQWGRFSDGHQCRNSNTQNNALSSTDTPGHPDFIYIYPGLNPNDWRSPQNNNLWQGVNGVNNPCPSGYRLPSINEWFAELNSWVGGDPANSVLNLTLGGYRQVGGAQIAIPGIQGRYWSSTTVFDGGEASRYFGVSATSGTLNFTNSYRGNGLIVRCIKEIQGTLGSLNCGSAVNTGTLTENQAASGVSSSVPYTGGNGGTHSGQIVSSTGVTGLTATLAAGTFAVGSGNLTYTISGTPDSAGTASFALNIGGQSCTLTINVDVDLVSQYPSGSVFCASGPTAIVDVINPSTGKTWMDRNLGASQVATSSTDANAYGDLYQWGRRSDGHQCRTSPTTTTLSSTDQPAHSSFILASNDWRSPQNNNLWQGVNGVNNPCPSGYRLPTETELNLERLSWSANNATGAFASPLRLPMTGYRRRFDNLFLDVGTRGSYWSSTVPVSSTASRVLYFSSGSTSNSSSARAEGCSVRCLKD